MVVNQRRVLLSILLFTLTLLGCLTIVPVVDKALFKVPIPIICTAVVSFSLYRFSIGQLIVRIDGSRLEFFWKKKFFNFSKIDSVEINAIRKLVIDNDQVLQKIITVDKVITLGIRKTGDAIGFIEFLSEATNAKTIDSWEVWAEKGLLKIAYIANLIILILVSALAIFFILTKGFSSHILYFVLGGVIQLYLYHGVIKGKLKN